jgi:hypothetical protein
MNRNQKIAHRLPTVGGSFFMRGRRPTKRNRRGQLRGQERMGPVLAAAKEEGKRRLWSARH